MAANGQGSTTIPVAERLSPIQPRPRKSALIHKCAGLCASYDGAQFNRPPWRRYFIRWWLARFDSHQARQHHDDCSSIWLRSIKKKCTKQIPLTI